MAIDDADRSVIERNSGTITPAQEESVELALDRLGSPEVVALERVMVRLSDFEMNTSVIGSADDQLNHRDNVPWLREKFASLVSSISTLVASGDLTLTTAAELVLADAQGTRSFTRPLSFSYTAPRRG